MNAKSLSARQKAARWKLLLVFLICAAPVIAALLAYYVWPPQGGQTNYGTLIEPQRPVPDAGVLRLTHLDGRSFDLHALRGRWVMLYASPADCDQRCKDTLFAMRQIRLMNGKERDRIERVWLMLDEVPVSTELIREYDGMWMLRASVEELQKFLPLPAAPDAALPDHVWLIDPLGNLMMRFPKDADPKRMHKDLAKLLYTTKGWVMNATTLPPKSVQ
ncbi:MAG: cytochrome C oxidase subunit I [Burkholderiaceae bacterium]|nr:MAG: cytochrome C oxidase subunit I [Burkholderiaceae bacterium]